MNSFKKGGAFIGFAAAGLLAGIVSVAAFSGVVSAQESHVADAADMNKMAPKCLDGQHTGRMHVVNDHTLLVYDQWQNAYKLDIGGPCRSMSDMSHFGFEFQGSTQICRAHDAMLLYSVDRERPVKCLINGVTPLTKAQANELDPG
ncbi:DUF6491 family protein [Asticcacaulis sp. EMRT-3]|uniref:DUF6491 family protein n=1 Tax=Asticcacaulis sp. EMRT-3 TaxID=3040349 RepID=UPI0024AF2AA6|nr:DUF6491 family protein [Asticcacaulis sp. EMRT-3]MDI7774293.1 DUF6491 family protein [Asticcacaulis sp. EMRT-3]